MNGENNFKLPLLNSCAPSRPRLLNITYLTEISGDNAEFVSSVLTTFQEESKDFMTKVWTHFNQRDFYSVRKASHAMKPTGSYIGVDALTVLIASLEKAAPCGDCNVVGTLILEIERTLKALNAEIDSYLARPKE